MSASDIQAEWRPILALCAELSHTGSAHCYRAMNLHALAFYAFGAGFALRRDDVRNVRWMGAMGEGTSN
jgi:hypothetical protein